MCDTLVVVQAGVVWFASYLSGGDVRRACTRRALGARPGEVDLDCVLSALRDHGGRTPDEGLRLVMPCAHASFLPTRSGGQTTGSMVSRLARGACTHLFTGTSAPCLSVMKPVPLGAGCVDTGPAPQVNGYDGQSLFWRGERLHRAVLRDYEARRHTFEAERAELEARALAGGASASDLWNEHRERAREWTARATAVKPRRPLAWSPWWRLQSWRDGIPAEAG